MLYRMCRKKVIARLQRVGVIAPCRLRATWPQTMLGGGNVSVRAADVDCLRQ
jgi:hypothetical protein